MHYPLNMSEEEATVIIEDNFREIAQVSHADLKSEALMSVYVHVHSTHTHLNRVVSTHSRSVPCPPAKRLILRKYGRIGSRCSGHIHIRLCVQLGVRWLQLRLILTPFSLVAGIWQVDKPQRETPVSPDPPCPDRQSERPGRRRTTQVIYLVLCLITFHNSTMITCYTP